MLWTESTEQLIAGSAVTHSYPDTMRQVTRGSLPNGVYTGVTAEVTDGAYGPAYGNFYITTRDPRARDIHGGGSGLPDPYADYQGWIPTYGCLRMQNADGVVLSRMIIDSGNSVVLTVVE